MKEQALEIAAKAASPQDKLNTLREYLQACVLRSLHESEAFRCLAFVGGTALRFCYNLPRFSEDLDFSLDETRNYKLEKWLAKLKRDLEFANFNIAVSLKAQGPVHSAWIKETGLLKETGLGQTGQKLSIKLEVDTNPPKGSRSETKVVNKFFLVALRRYDLPSLMAGKIHALTCRKYLKGRDWYDLLWYRSQVPPMDPNVEMLQAAIDQTEKPPWPAIHWKNHVLEKLAAADISRLVSDVEPFLERPEEIKLLTREFLKSSLGLG